MKPFSFRFKETPLREALDFSLIRYDQQLNLGINNATGKPAVDILSKPNDENSECEGIDLLMDTVTFTKAQGDETDSDQGLSLLMDTTTNTFTAMEASDTDRDRRNIQALIDTSTLTESQEATDQDK